MWKKSPRRGKILRWMRNERVSYYKAKYEFAATAHLDYRGGGRCGHDAIPALLLSARRYHLCAPRLWLAAQQRLRKSRSRITFSAISGCWSYRPHRLRSERHEKPITGTNLVGARSAAITPVNLGAPRECSAIACTSSSSARSLFNTEGRPQPCGCPLHSWLSYTFHSPFLFRGIRAFSQAEAQNRGTGRTIHSSM